MTELSGASTMHADLNATCESGDIYCVKHQREKCVVTLELVCGVHCVGL